MAQENITVHLDDDHENGRKAIIRSYVRNKDRRKVQRAMLNAKEFSEDEFGSGDQTEVKMKVAGGGLVDYTDTQVETLLVEYQGDSDHPFDTLMNAEDNGDYEKISDAVQKVYQKYENPKG